MLPINNLCRNTFHAVAYLVAVRSGVGIGLINLHIGHN